MLNNPELPETTSMDLPVLYIVYLHTFCQSELLILYIIPALYRTYLILRTLFLWQVWSAAGSSIGAHIYNLV